jgi:hypothetical protein
MGLNKHTHTYAYASCKECSFVHQIQLVCDVHGAMCRVTSVQSLKHQRLSVWQPVVRRHANTYIGPRWADKHTDIGIGQRMLIGSSDTSGVRCAWCHVQSGHCTILETAAGASRLLSPSRPSLSGPSGPGTSKRGLEYLVLDISECHF